MGIDLSIFGDKGISSYYIEWLIDERSGEIQRHFGRFWEYYANTIADEGIEAIKSERGRSYVQAQEYGLPARITGIMNCGQRGVFGGRNAKEIQRKEVVIENDIAWRVNAAVDFLFGKPISFISRSPERQRRAEIESILKAVFAANGDIGFFQNMAVLGGVYGFVDCLVRPGEEVLEQLQGYRETVSFEEVVRLAGAIGLELIEAPRALAILDEDDYKKIRYYVQHFYQKKNTISGGSGFLSRLFGGGERGGDVRETAAITEIISDGAWQRYENKELIAEGKNQWGFVPVVHIQNLAQPYYYEGQSDVEVLIPLQDELNTRLSDRASRITFQSFKMYLGKGIDDFVDRPVAPGTMWQTSNLDASIEEFGGDSSVPSEEMHIAEIREAMDKISSVTPLVAGVIKDKLGNLTSAVALKLTLMGMLSKTDRKRFTYGQGITKICRMVLEILDKANIYKSSEKERDVDIVFQSPLPENLLEKLQEAQIKKELGVPTGQLLRELGYETEAKEQKLV